MPTSSFFLEQLIHKPILRNLPYDDENPSKVAILRTQVQPGILRVDTFWKKYLEIPKKPATNKNLLVFVHLKSAEGIVKHVETWNIRKQIHRSLDFL